MSSPNKRRDVDVMKLMMGDYNVETTNDGLSEFNVEFHGPKDSIVPASVFSLYMVLNLVFMKVEFGRSMSSFRMFILSSLLLSDLLTRYSTQTSMNYLLNIFEVFLPQLLLYPNPSDPLNGDAASLMMKDKALYERRVKEYCERYAKENVNKSKEEEESDDDDISDGHCTSSDDIPIPGRADP